MQDLLLFHDSQNERNLERFGDEEDEKVADGDEQAGRIKQIEINCTDNDDSSMSKAQLNHLSLTDKASRRPSPASAAPKGAFFIETG